MKQTAFLNVDEFVAIAIIIISFFAIGAPVLDWLRGVAIIYLLICVAIRKYEDVLRRQKK